MAKSKILFKMLNIFSAALLGVAAFSGIAYSSENIPAKKAEMQKAKISSNPGIDPDAQAIPAEAVRSIEASENNRPIVAGEGKEIWNLYGRLTLKENLSKWAKKSGMELKWETFDDADWEVGVDYQIKGTLNEALNVVLKAFAAKNVYLKPIFFSNNVLLIKQTYARFINEN